MQNSRQNVLSFGSKWCSSDQIIQLFNYKPSDFVSSLIKNVFMYSENHDLNELRTMRKLAQNMFSISRTKLQICNGVNTLTQSWSSFLGKICQKCDKKG